MKDEITFDRQAVNTLDKLIAQAINIDDKLFKRVMEKHHDRGYSHPAWHVSNHYKLSNKAPPHDPYSYAPMELDAVHHKGRFTKGRNNKKGKALKCYACGKLGHMAKDCCSKNKVHRQQLNTLNRDWNVIKPEDPPGEAQLSLEQ